MREGIPEVDGFGIAAVLGAIGILLAQVTTSYLQIKASNRVTAAAEAMPVALTDAQKPVMAAVERAAEAVVKNTEALEGPVAEKLELVHTATNSALERATIAEKATQVKLDEVIASRDAGTLLTLDAVRRQVDETKTELAAARAEIVRLNAAAAPREGTS